MEPKLRFRIYACEDFIEIEGIGGILVRKNDLLDHLGSVSVMKLAVKRNQFWLRPEDPKFFVKIKNCLDL